MTDVSILQRVQKLLDKAARTEFDHEREALISKAQQLMVAHAIDQAQLDQARPAQRQQPIVKVFRLAESQAYVSLKQDLLWAIDDPNRCEAIVRTRWDRELNRRVKDAHVVGFPDDVAWVEMLFTSLLVQLFGGAERAWQQLDPTERHYSNRRTFTVSYGDGFIDAIRTRLQEANQQATRDAETHSPGAALVLADRAEVVKRAKEEHFPRVRTARPNQRSQFSADGWYAGQEDGQRANLNRAGQVGTARQALPGVAR